MLSVYFLAVYKTIKNAQNADVLKRESETPFKALHTPPSLQQPLFTVWNTSRQTFYVFLNSHLLKDKHNIMHSVLYAAFLKILLYV